MKGLKHSAAALGLVLVTAGVALASEGGGEHHADWGNFAFRVANFVIFIGIIYWAAGKKIVGFFSGRRKGIEQELNDLESRKAEAAKNLADAEYRAQGEAMQAAIIEKAEKTASQITEQAARTAENEIKQAMETMRAEMADQIIAAAEKMLQEKLTGEEHEKLIDKYLTKVVLN